LTFVHELHSLETAQDISLLVQSEGMEADDQPQLCYLGDDCLEADGVQYPDGPSPCSICEHERLVHGQCSVKCLQKFGISVPDPFAFGAGGVDPDTCCHEHLVEVRLRCFIYSSVDFNVF